MTLPTCHSRSGLDGTEQLAFCHHPRVHVDDSVVTPSMCAICHFPPEPAPTTRRPFGRSIETIWDTRLKDFAVVVLSHNYGRFMSECLESVLAQTYPPAQNVVVDDA
jgi:hypothetical protein